MGVRGQFWGKSFWSNDGFVDLVRTNRVTWNVEILDTQGPPIKWSSVDLSLTLTLILSTYPHHCWFFSLIFVLVLCCTHDAPSIII